MGYMHIENLYKNQLILLFRECYAMEKIHGTSAHLAFRRKQADLSTPEKCAKAFLERKESAVTAKEFSEVLARTGKDPNKLASSDMKEIVQILKEYFGHINPQDFQPVFSSFLRARNQFAGWDVNIFSGGASHGTFAAIFNLPDLCARMNENMFDEMTIFGEAYGGSMQGMSDTYGKTLCFAAFDVRMGTKDDGVWLEVPNAEKIVRALGLEFVHYTKVSTDLTSLDAARDANSVQAVRNGIAEPRKMEGVVLRPLIELSTKNGDRIICKHKRADFSETKTVREVSPEQNAALTDARTIANEWVTETRLQHVYDNVFGDLNAIAAVMGEELTSLGMEHTQQIIRAMVEDVKREAGEEIIWSDLVEKQIKSATVSLWKKRTRSVQ